MTRCFRSKRILAWADTYLRSDPTSAAWTPPTVKIPNGRAADTADIERGRFTYDPGRIRVPTLIVMGELDAIAARHRRSATRAL